VLSPDGPGITVVGKLLCDGDIDGWLALITVGWLDGRMLRDGDAIGRVGGGICCEVLRDEGIEEFEVTRGEEARGLGDGGTELRSGAIMLC
jgi:hypothetical protein